MVLTSPTASRPIGLHGTLITELWKGFQHLVKQTTRTHRVAYPNMHLCQCMQLHQWVSMVWLLFSELVKDIRTIHGRSLVSRPLNMLTIPMVCVLLASWLFACAQSLSSVKKLLGKTKMLTFHGKMSSPQTVTKYYMTAISEEYKQIMITIANLPSLLNFPWIFVHRSFGDSGSRSSYRIQACTSIKYFSYSYNISKGDKETLKTKHYTVNMYTIVHLCTDIH